MSADKKSQPDTAREIMRYLREHPDAQDTIKGIAQWWLLEHQVTTTVSMVEQAIEYLAARKFVVRVQGRNGQYRYRFNPEMTHQLHQELDESAGGTKS